jgi:hypothetical protein
MVIFVCLGTGLYWLFKYGLKPDTKIKQSQGVVTNITFDSGKTKHIEQQNFSIDLPADWEVVGHDERPLSIFRYRGTGKKSSGRQLEIYEDTIPVNFAINRVLSIEASNNRLTLRGSVSDNCAEFTKDTAKGQVGTKAKWQGIDFLCDLANYQRNVVGTSSPDGINSVMLHGPTTGTHHYFFSYTENSFNDDYSPFYSILQSFSLK